MPPVIPAVLGAVVSNVVSGVIGGGIIGAIVGGDAVYDGYGSCPLTVERGKIVLAEFGYGGKRLPSFPSWLIDGRRPSRLAWHLKSEALPSLYWNAMLKGREWLCAPDCVEPGVAPRAQESAA